MRQNQPLVSINILTYNGEKYIKECLNSVFNQEYSNIEILIIDNNSTDKRKSYLKKLKNRPELKIIFNKKNLGYAGGHNQGIRISQGKYILCLNQDVRLDRYFIKNAVCLLEKDKKIGAIQGKLLRWNLGNTSLEISDKNDVFYIIDTVGLCILKNRRIINIAQGEIDQKQFEKEQEIFGADGAAPVYRREALEDIKIVLSRLRSNRASARSQNYSRIKDLDNLGEYFDENFFLYKEDVDLAWRLRLYKWKTIYQPKSVAWHDRSSGESASISYLAMIKERRKINKFAKYLAFKNQRLMQIKNEQFGILIKHLPWFLPKEILSWLYVMLFEKYTWKAIRDLFGQSPLSWEKRKIIMAHKKAGIKEMEKWFN